MLLVAEFAYNNSYTTAIKTTPFYANYGFHPKTMWPTKFETKNPASSVYGHWLKSVHTKIADTLEERNRRTRKYYEQRNQDQANMSIGDLVMWSASDAHKKRATKKLAPT